ncbi:hypothetical protein RH915_10150 [Serpentinicella sp. ANB-PHB4]|uniref:hypothetical protein n=1 Tax=Serpentinicella sp. ANB-PHB4 TaxID=3074076 RepID=UPI0028647A03|nr:hypothetical protein [Serpentinicella sp. ANB-PHB4]MDR5659850.1 hypothetical protein [Serpentinicella sp. ANB-PHB4]
MKTKISEFAQGVFHILDLVFIGFILVIGWFLQWLFLPPMFRFDMLIWWIYLIALTTPIGIYFAARRFKYLQYLAVVPVLLVVLNFGYAFINSGIFTADERHGLIGEVEEKPFKEDMNVVDTSRLRILDSNDALRHAENRLGSETGLGSQFELRESSFTLQTVGENFYWVAPLEHRGFFRWRSNREGSPGYIKVNATTRETELVRDFNIKYTQSAYLSNDIKRHVYQNYSRTKAYTDFSFEIDPEGHPYYVITVYDNEIGRKGSIEEGILLVDATDGGITFFEDNNAPEWVNRIVPEAFYQERLKYWGRYPNGWFNPSNEGQLKPSSGRNMVYNDGRAYYYSGITSWGADESTNGFMLMDSRTGEVTFYRVSGATETKAMNIAEGRVQNAGYSASFPILISVGGEPTYFITLKDSNNNIAEYAFVSVKDYMRSGVSRSLETAQLEYMMEIGLRSDTDFIVDESELEEAAGVIERINPVVIEGDTYYFIKLEGSNKLYRGSFKNHVNLVLTQPGDNVDMAYIPSEDNEIKIFKNENMN